MPHEPAGIWVLVAIIAAVALIVSAGVARTRMLSTRVGSFTCSTRALGDAEFAIGIAQYAEGRIDWYRSWSLSPWPARRWVRDRFHVLGRRPVEQPAFGDQFVVQCRHGDADFELMMSSSAYSGLASWLESAPPGRRDIVV
jgi:hypothetical protein